MSQSEAKLKKVQTFLQTIQGFSALGLLKQDSENGWQYEHILDRGQGALMESEKALASRLIAGFTEVRGLIGTQNDWTELVWVDPEDILYMFRLSEHRAVLVHFRTEQVPRFGVGLLAHLKRNLATLLN